MKRLAAFCLVCASLASCGPRVGPPAALTRCFTQATPVMIDGTPERALATRCIEEDGSLGLHD
jgi:hypothetical protein